MPYPGRPGFRRSRVRVTGRWRAVRVGGRVGGWTLPLPNRFVTGRPGTTDPVAEGARDAEDGGTRPPEPRAAAVSAFLPARARDAHRTILVVRTTLAAVPALIAVLPGAVAGTALLLMWGPAYGGVSVSLQTRMIKAAPRSGRGGLLPEGGHVQLRDRGRRPRRRAGGRRDLGARRPADRSRADGGGRRHRVGRVEPPLAARRRRGTGPRGGRHGPVGTGAFAALRVRGAPAVRAGTLRGRSAGVTTSEKAVPAVGTNDPSSRDGSGGSDIRLDRGHPGGKSAPRSRTTV